MTKERYFLTGFIFETASNTIRCMPQNYWIASIKDNKIYFDSWDSAIRGRYSKFIVRLLWKFNLIKPAKDEKPAKENKR